MEELLDRINVLELKVHKAVEMIRRLKKENQILFKENIRLKEEINQLSKSVKGGMSSDLEATDVESEKSHSKINVEQVKAELDRCLDELNECIAMVDK